MLKKINLFLCMIICFFSVNNVYAYDVPSNSFYINVDSNLGNIDIWFPSDKVQYLLYDSELSVINTSSSNIYGYANVNNVEYSITFPTFNKPYYRDGYTNVDLNITNLISSNINFTNSDTQLFLNDTIINQIIVITLSLEVVALWLILFKR